MAIPPSVLTLAWIGLVASAFILALGLSIAIAVMTSDEPEKFNVTAFVGTIGPLFLLIGYGIYQGVPGLHQ